MFITQEAHLPPHGAARHGRHDGAAVARRDGAGATRCSPRRLRPAKVRLSASRWCTARPAAPSSASRRTCGRRRRSGAQFDLSPTQPQRARAVPRLPDHRQQHRRAQRRSVQLPEIGGDHFRSSAVFLTQAHPKQTQGSDVCVGTVARSAVRAEVRPGHADSVDAAVHRERRPGRRLRLRLRVRLHRHHQLGGREDAAADDSRSARGLRSAVRRRRHARRARRAPPRRPQHPRLDHRRSLAPAQRRSAPPIARGSIRLSRRRPRDRAPHPEDRSAQQQRRAARAAGRAGRRAGFVRRARQADVRPAGARVRVGHHARVLVQDGPRRLGPRLSGERRQHCRSTRRRTTASARIASPTSRRSTATTSACCRTSSRS